VCAGSESSDISVVVSSHTITVDIIVEVLLCSIVMMVSIISRVNNSREGMLQELK